VSPRYLLLRVLTLVADVPGWLVVLLFRLLWGGKITSEGGCLVLRMSADGWPVRTWYRNWGGTTLGHAILVNPRREVSKLVFHELRHVEQYEGFSVAGVVFGLVFLLLGHPLAAVSSAALAGFLCMLSAMTVAWMRGEDFYRGSATEEAAYDAEKLTADGTRDDSSYGNGGGR